ncbi:MAG: DUF2442 domain-containing protein [Verrucomicrobia subdivision 3 bacterium]|nr:DUF2442 domain-containing protein [Limisphaerales bacterium]
MNSSADKIKDIRVTRETLTVTLADGRVMAVPMSPYPTLQHAKPAARKDCKLLGAGYGIEWPKLDYHLSAEGLLNGWLEPASLQIAAPEEA